MPAGRIAPLPAALSSLTRAGKPAFSVLQTTPQTDRQPLGAFPRRVSGNYSGNKTAGLPPVREDNGLRCPFDPGKAVRALIN